jgi:hypothetical protein
MTKTSFNIPLRGFIVEYSLNVKRKKRTKQTTQSKYNDILIPRLLLNILVKPLLHGKASIMILAS